MSKESISSRLQGQVIAFRTDASLEIGSGHVMRCLTLANALGKQGAECHFLCREHQGHLCKIIEAQGFAVHRLAKDKPNINNANISNHEPAHAHWLGTSWMQDAGACLPVLAKLKPAWLVVDHYALDYRWEQEVIEKCSDSPLRVLVIDDLADRRHFADVLLDQNLGRCSEDYHDLVPETCNVLVGPRYALLRPEFAEWREYSLRRRTQELRLQRLLINLGGVDKDNVTGQVLNALTNCDLPDELQICVVMGATAPWREQVAAQASKMPWPTEVVVNATDIAKRMAEADLAIGAAGSTSWERCCLGLPTLMIVLADNQQEVASYLDELGAAKLIGTPLELPKLLPSIIHKCFYGDYAEMSKFSAQIVRGDGVFKIVSAIFKS